MTGAVVWITGLPAAGKTTLARRLIAQLRRDGRACLTLDSDEVRTALGLEHDYSEQVREDFYRALGRLAASLARQEMIVVVAATANRQVFRDWARHAAPRFVEVYLRTSLQECERRDAKGLYAKARTGLVGNMPGVDAGFEIPLHPDVVAEGGLDDMAIESVIRVLAYDSHASP